MKKPARASESRSQTRKEQAEQSVDYPRIDSHGASACLSIDADELISNLGRETELQRAKREAFLQAHPEARKRLQLSPLPEKAPERWAERDLNLREKPPAFIKRVYGKWLARGHLARKDLAKLDPDLYKALSVWLSRHSDDEIAKLLPSQSDLIDRLIDQLTLQYPAEVLRKLAYAITSRERRLNDRKKSK